MSEIFEQERKLSDRDPGTVRYVHGHTCPLPIEDDLITLHINSGICVEWRRQLRRLFLVHPAHPRAADFYKSTTQFRLERARHLQQYYTSIHPFSMGRFLFECLTIFVYLALFHIMPILGSLKKPPRPVYLVRHFFDLFTYADIIMLFFTGYVDKEKSRVMLYRKSIVVHYLKGFFVIDLISVIPLYTFTKILNYKEMIEIRIIAYMLKLARLPTFFRYIENLYEYMKYNKTYFHFLEISMYLWILVYWTVAVGLIVYCNEYNITLSLDVSDQGRNLLMNEYLKSFYVTARSFLLISTVPDSLHSLVGQLFKIAAIVIGAVFNIVLFVQIYKIVQRRSGSRKHFEDTIVEMEEYMKYKEMDHTLKEKIHRYIDFRYDRNILTHEAIAENVSTIIKNDILRHNYKELFTKIPFFTDLTDQMMLLIMRKLRQEIFFKGDVIIKAGTPATCMYFIKNGVVATYSSNNIEMSHMEDGACISEYTLIIDVVLHQITCVAVQNCELIRLTRKDFHDALKEYPKALEEIKMLGLSRLSHLRKQLMLDADD